MKPERRVRWVVWIVRGIAVLGIVGALVLAWVVATALRPYFP